MPPRVCTAGAYFNRLVSLQVEALTSVRTQLPYEYYVLPFCNQGVDLNTQEALNLGEVLFPKKPHAAATPPRQHQSRAARGELWVAVTRGISNAVFLPPPGAPRLPHL